MNFKTASLLSAVQVLLNIALKYQVQRKSIHNFRLDGLIYPQIDIQT
jgi:hypothetical protein